MKKLLKIATGCLLLAGFAVQFLSAQTLAFPGAEGFGRFASGGRGGTVYHVTNLNDSGSGSFRDAVSQSNRTVVFDVGGIINIGERIVIKSNVTVAGQTAPGGGITIYGNGIALNGDSGNDIIRYIRIRMGKNGDDAKDAVGISENTNYMFDHVSITWGRDGTFDINGTGIDNVTIQNCIIGQGINNTNHSTGGLMQSGKISVIRTLWIDNKTRNPKGRGPQEYINNVIYNWAEHGYILGDTEGLSEANIMGNYFINGPSTAGNCFNSATASFHVYAWENYWDKNKNGVLDGTLVANSEYGPVTFESSAYPYYGVSNLMTPAQAYNNIVNDVGASLVRDAVDNFLINQLKSLGTQGSIINTEDDNGIPGNVGTVAGGTAPADSDQDGMPDTWENSNGLNANNASDRNNFNLNSQYTNLEVYLNGIAGGGSIPTSAPTAPPSETPAPTTPPAETANATANPTDTPGPTSVPGQTAAPTTPPADTSAPTTPPSGTTVPATGCTCTNLCTSQTGISAPFTFDGIGEYCWTSSSLASYVNSWNCDAVNINGTNCTNIYVSSSSITAIGGIYYIYYKSSYSWSHFEVK